MTNLFAALVLAAIVGGALAGLLVVVRGRTQKIEPRLGAAVFLVVFVAVVGVAGLTDAAVQIEAGSVGVVKRFGKVTGVFNPGLNFKMPFVDEVVVYRTQEIVYETSDTPSDSRADYRDVQVDTATSDGQAILARYTVRFRIRPERAPDIVQNLGTEAEVVERVVKASSRVHVRNILKQYQASQLYSGDVEQAQNKIAERLQRDFEGVGLELMFFGLRSIQFTDQYKQAVEQKQIEAENIQTKRNLAQQAEYEKERAIIQAQAEAERERLDRIGIAQGEAEAVRLRAEADAEAIKIRAQAQAEANRMIAESLIPELIEWQAVNGWNGEYPLVIGGGQFILPGDLFARASADASSESTVQPPAQPQPSPAPPSPTPTPEAETEAPSSNGTGQ